MRAITHTRLHSNLQLLENRKKQELCPFVVFMRHASNIQLRLTTSHWQQRVSLPPLMDRTCCNFCRQAVGTQYRGNALKVQIVSNDTILSI